MFISTENVLPGIPSMRSLGSSLSFQGSCCFLDSSATKVQEEGKALSSPALVHLTAAEAFLCIASQSRVQRNFSLETTSAATKGRPEAALGWTQTEIKATSDRLGSCHSRIHEPSLKEPVLQAVCWRVTAPKLGYAFIIHLHTQGCINNCSFAN